MLCCVRLKAVSNECRSCYTRSSWSALFHDKVDAAPFLVSLRFNGSDAHGNKPQRETHMGEEKKKNNPNREGT